MRISILTPSYNYARFLPDTLASVAGQTEVDVEHVVVDDGSTDGSVELLQSWPGPLVLVTQGNYGLAHTLNRALALATGEIIGWLNADDFYLPGVLSQVVGSFRAAPEVHVFYGDPVFVDEQGRVQQLKPQHRMSRRTLSWYGSFVAPCAAFRRRESLPSPAWDPSYRVFMDWDQDLRMLAAGAKFARLPLPVGAFRRHDDQQSTVRAAGDRAEAELMAERYGIRPTRPGRSPRSVAGNLLHASLKSREGGYATQRRAASLRGRDLRWWSSADAAGTAAALAGAYRNSDKASSNAR